MDLTKLRKKGGSEIQKQDLQNINLRYANKNSDYRYSNEQLLSLFFLH